MSLGDELDYGEFLFDSDGQVKNTGIKKLVFAREFEEHELNLRIGKREFYFEEVNVKKIQAEPVFGHRVKLTFQCQLRPEEDDIGPVLDGLVHGCDVAIQPGDIHDAEEEVTEEAQA